MYEIYFIALLCLKLNCGAYFDTIISMSNANIPGLKIMNTFVKK